MTLITSTANPRIKFVRALEKRRDRDASGLFVVEGAREISRALASGWEPAQAFVCRALQDDDGAQLARSLEQRCGGDYCEVSEPVFAAMARRESSDGVLALFKSKALPLSALRLSGSPLLIAVQGVEKPGNLGALMRSADGAGCDGFIIVDGGTDVFNPNTVRASLGALFSLPLAVCTEAEFMSFCRKSGVAVYAAALTEGARMPWEFDLTAATAILLGSEDRGLPSSLVSAAAGVMKLPMEGLVDSLNVSVAGGILMYEARRQRRSAGRR